MLTALVVHGDADARGRIAGLLRMTGWQVREATGLVDALRWSAELELDLVVTGLELPAGNGPALLRRLRRTGCHAQFLVVAADPTEQVRADAAAAGAVACLAEPVDARLLLDFLRGRTTGPAAQEALPPLRDPEDLHDADLDADLMDRLQEMYMSALPDRLSAIASGARSGNAVALASAASALEGTSGQLGHPDVAAVCRDIARDARRGVLAHARLVELQALATA